MQNRNLQVNVYIEKSAAFAKPILTYLRNLIHEVCPDIKEEIKWSFPNFIYKDEILCNIAGFNNHCSFGFWKAALLKDPENILRAVGKTGMGDLGKIQSLEDLPDKKVLKAYIQEAMNLNEGKVKIPRKAIAKKVELIIPGDFLVELERNKVAHAVFNRFSYSNKKEYTEWITDAKTEITRAKRIATSIEWISEGKTRNWKYLK